MTAKPLIRPRRLVLLGSVLVDLPLQVPHLPPRGGDVVARPRPPTAGGGFNVLSAAARLGLPAVYAGRVGGGPFGALVRSALAAEGVELALYEPAAGDTGYCAVLVEPDGERTFVTAPGVEAELSAAALAAVPLADGDAVYVSGYDLVYPVNGPVLAAYLAALPAGRLLVMDPGPLVTDIPLERWAPVLARTDLLSLNDREAAMLRDANREVVQDADRALPPDADRAMLRDANREVVQDAGRALPPDAGRTMPPDADRPRLLPSGPPTVVVRSGPAGATLHRRNAAPQHFPGVPVTAIDSTGAGDVHVAALLAALADGADLAHAVVQANRAAAYSVTRAGPATGPTRAQLAALQLPG